MLKSIKDASHIQGNWQMKHEQILQELLEKAGSDTNTLGFLVFGSVASGTYHEESDIDTMTIVRHNKPSSGIENKIIDGIKVGNIFFTHDILIRSVNTVPYLLHPLGNAKLLFDRESTIKPLLTQITTYFDENSKLEKEWNRYYKQLKEEKAQFGHEKTTIIDVWNELEKRYSGGRIKRPFFNAFYFTNSVIFSLLKRFM
jgi:predicted nucleotidyltransferase